MHITEIVKSVYRVCNGMVCMRFASSIVRRANCSLL
ncbi:hypothetical protein SLEP1_g58384 [Rubroshorea leprosula]|uniref:Uncharacterized protein n=1 Tax=Rubroshorea leprosula TaxID=152421 RepID=A0AAV5MRX9_9ROSI|nr:hypothetical protein SLEP1_g58384 [Rubroshorea leprosula]